METNVSDQCTQIDGSDGVYIQGHACGVMVRQANGRVMYQTMAVPFAEAIAAGTTEKFE